MRNQRSPALLAALIIAAAIAAPAAASPSPGTVDTTFGSAGVTLSQFSQDALSLQTAASAEAIAPGGDIYQAGTTVDPSGNSEIFIARYLPSGVLDTGFGIGGVGVAQIGQGATKMSGGAATTQQSIALTPSGEVIVPTAASDASGGTQIAVVEFTSSGALDPGFGTGGVYYDDSASTASPKVASAAAAAVQSDGRIVITANATLTTGGEAFVRRLNADGSVDGGFATGGTFMAPPGTPTHPTQLAGVIVDTAQNVVFTGTSPDATGNPAVLLGRLTTGGASDLSQVLQASALGAAAQSGGFSVMQAAGGDDIVGADAFVASPGVLGGIPSWVAVAFAPTGTPDPAFGPSGTGITALLPGALAPTSIAQQANGRLVYAGISGIGGGTAGLVVARTLPNGTLDPSFGATGVVTLPYGGQSLGLSGAIGTDGQLTVSGLQLLPTGLLTSTTQALIAKIILDRPPSVVVAAPTAIAGQPATFTAATVADSAVAGVNWDLGSGTFADASGLTATKTFASPGTYTVRVQATDDDNLSTIATQTVTVVAAPSAPPPAIVTVATTVTTPTTVTTVTPTPLPAADCTSSARPTARITAKILSPQGLLLAGTAAAHCPNQVTSVSIAIARVKAKKCGYLTSAHRWGRYGKCTAPKTYLRATGTNSWAVGLKLKLTKGTYWIWQRATDDHRQSTINTAGGHTVTTRR